MARARLVLVRAGKDLRLARGKGAVLKSKTKSASLGRISYLSTALGMAGQLGWRLLCVVALTCRRVAVGQGR